MSKLSIVCVLLGSMVVGCASKRPEPVKLAASKPPAGVALPGDSPLLPADIGLIRTRADVSVPAGYKLLVLTSLYHGEKLEEQRYFQFIAPKPVDGYSLIRLEGSVFDPSTLMPESAGKYRISIAIDGGAYVSKWVTADQNGAGVSAAGFGETMKPGQTHQVMEVHVSGPMVEVPGQKGVKTGGPAAWKLTAEVRQEPLSDKELQENHPKVTMLDADKFPKP
ncbi:MAG TPA: hypothetical protein VK968_06485 [Roseimicrobium sp.]|nr:hypothetical protein [Roseimicrobium sp.]